MFGEIFRQVMGGMGRVDRSSMPSDPWPERPSIYGFIVQNLDGETGRLRESGWNLPDEAKPADGGVSFAPGALEGIFGAHGGVDEERQIDKVAKIVTALKRASEKPSLRSIGSLHQLLEESSFLEYVDALLDGVREESGMDPVKVHRLAMWLAQRAPDRDSVKAAIALLGLTVDPSIESGAEGIELLKTLGVHEEFTFFAAVALSNSLDEPEAAVWELAQAVDGWGRIRTVELLKDTADPSIQRWLLCEGYENSIMNDYTALICAETGGLLAALRRDPDDAEFHGAGQILMTLINEQIAPAETIDDYPDGVEAVGLYLDLLLAREPKLPGLGDVVSIDELLQGDEANWSVNGPTSAQRTEFKEQCRQVLADDRWTGAVQRGVESGSEDELPLAVSGAVSLGVDVWDALFERLIRDRNENPWLWSQLSRSEKPERIDQIIASAQEAIALEVIGTGPEMFWFGGPHAADHLHLETALEVLVRTPGEGWALIKAGLTSSMIRQRSTALKALGPWGKERWGPDVRSALEDARAWEDDDFREQVDRVLTGVPVE